MNQIYSPILEMMAFVLGLLTLSSGVAWYLLRKSRSEEQLVTLLNLNDRIKGWWVLILVFFTACFLGKGTLVCLFALVSFFALREFLSIMPTHGADHWSLSLSFFVILPFQYYLVWIGWYGLLTIFIPVYVFLFLPSLSIFQGEVDDFLPRIAKNQWGVMLAIYCISYVPALLILGKGQAGLELIFYLLIVVQLSDVFQYTFGKLFGKTKLAPRVSPSKTVEGLVGGGCAAIVAGSWLAPYCGLSLLEGGVCASVIVVMGFLGGLVLSGIKRSMGVKDWGYLIEGHGGMLDRVDSVCFAAPIFFHLVRYWVF
jgi:phosphatidate cytidylyltransferase